MRPLSTRHESTNLNVDKVNLNFDGTVTVRRFLNQTDPIPITNASESIGNGTVINQA